MTATEGWRGRGVIGTLPVALVVGGSDSSGMAGIQMDVRTLHAFGVHAATAVTAVTAQNSAELVAINAVSAEVMQQQLSASLALRPVLIKAGVLVSKAQIDVLADVLERTGLPLVLDPVCMSSSGGRFIDHDVKNHLLTRLLPHCLLLTPNLIEAAWLTGITLTSTSAVEAAADKLLERGAGAVLIKGGHREDQLASDYFASAHHHFWLQGPRLPVSNTRGSGCAMASAISAALVLGYRLEDGVVLGRMAINQGLRQAYPCGDQRGPVAITHFPDATQDLPELRTVYGVAEPRAFPDCGAEPIGLYPVVDRASWLARLLPLGVTTAQLRIKDLTGPELAQETATAVAIARAHRCRLFINDHWQLAIATGAYGVHLGQADLATADLARIRQAGLRLGISTHCHHEVARARALRPSYIACGPVFPTATKQMPWHPLGMKGLQYWRQILQDCQLVAIGGIDRQRLPSVIATGVDGIALISAITGADCPEEATAAMLRILRAWCRTPVSGATYE